LGHVVVGAGVVVFVVVFGTVVVGEAVVAASVTGAAVVAASSTVVTVVVVVTTPGCTPVAHICVPETASANSRVPGSGGLATVHV
jgi:hypothetical protein